MQYWYNGGTPRNRLIAFKNAYHGDTFGAMSVSGRSSFTTPFSPLLFDVDFIDAPVNGKEAAAEEQLRYLLSERKNEIRSEEHTSELQSLMRISYAVFCLKKKKLNKTIHINHHETHSHYSNSHSAQNDTK